MGISEVHKTAVLNRQCLSVRSDLEILIFPRPKASFSPVYAPVDHSKEPRSMERPRGNGLRPPRPARCCEQLLIRSLSVFWKKIADGRAATAVPGPMSPGWRDGRWARTAHGLMLSPVG